MTHQQEKIASKEAGFTLVELAIVMIIIGLLIGGVLKGQELITNAQITSTIAQVKGFDSAANTFKDMYQGPPGDIANAGTRIPNCAGTCIPTAASSTIGDGRIDLAGSAPVTFAAAVVATGEMIASWQQMNAANLISGINPGAAVPVSWGGDFPSGKINGSGFDVGYSDGTALSGSNAAAGATHPGHYYALHGTAGTAVGTAAGDLILTPSEASRIDNKLDDGVESTGSVLGASTTHTAAGCDLAGVYQEKNAGNWCSLYIESSF